jgi:hypothetical protein
MIYMQQEPVGLRGTIWWPPSLSWLELQTRSSTEYDLFFKFYELLKEC